MPLDPSLQALVKQAAAQTQSTPREAIAIIFSIITLSGLLLEKNLKNCFP